MELASMQENLRNEGWYLTEAAVNQLTENGQITDVKTIIKKALDIDLREISEGGLPEDVNKTKYENIVGKVVLQIQKIKNVSCPKTSEFNFNNSVHTILKVILTDGIQSIQGVNLNVINNININTYPGSKVCLIGAPPPPPPVEQDELTEEQQVVDKLTGKSQANFSCGFLLLTNTNVQFLGGQVTNLIEKWQLNRSLAKHTRVRQDDCGPPPWIPFGQKIIKQNINDNNFKSLDLGKNKDNLENKEFEAQRKGAILEATKIGSTKVFGGGNNKLLDHNVQLIVDAGFTIDQAEYALKLTKNNVDRALRNLQSKYNKNQSDGGKSSKTTSDERKPNTKGKHRYKDEESGVSLKPSGKVSLFDFLEDKLPIVEKESPPVVETRLTNNTYYDKRNSGPGRGNRGNRGGGGGVSNRYQGDRTRQNYEPRREQQPKRNYYDQKQYTTPRMSTHTTNVNTGSVSKDNTRRNNNQLGNFIKKDQQSDSGKKQNNFTEKPPRFQRLNQEHSANIQNWNSEQHQQQQSYQLEINMAGMNINLGYRDANNTRTQDVTMTGAGKLQQTPQQSNMYYENQLNLSSGPVEPNSNTTPSVQSQQQHPPPHLPDNYIKNFNYNMLQQEYHYKTNGSVMAGFSDGPALLNNVRNTSDNTNPMRYQPHYMAYHQPAPPPQAVKKRVWHKGDKCMARYWEDQMFYKAEVTAVSENTCVVKFIDYNNFEEVLQDHCLPLTEES